MRGRADLTARVTLPAKGTRAAQVIGAFLCSAPLFVLTLRGWSNFVLLGGALACLAFLFARRQTLPAETDASRRFWGRALLVTMIAPLAAVFISSWVQGRFHLPRFDSSARALAAIPILVFAIRTRLDAARLLHFMLPAALAATLAHQYLTDQPHRWGEDRMATYFADPLVFGYISLAFGLMCLMSIRRGSEWGERSPWTLLLKVMGTAAGLYLSIKSGSRTGWLALPVVLALWLHLNGGGSARWVRLAFLACAVLASALVYQLSETVHTRVDLAIGEVLGYPWGGVVVADTAVGLRITFLRIARDIFLSHPWAGIGDTTHSALAQAAAFPYATAAAVNTAFQSGFHNEIVTNAVRSGVSGIVSSAAWLLVPLAIFARYLRDGDKVASDNAAVGIAFSICIAVGSLTTEVLDLKYTASFYSLMIAVLCGATLARHGQE